MPYFLFFLFLSGACVKADAATDLTVLLLFFDLSNLEAFDATLFEVFSFFAIFSEVTK